MPHCHNINIYCLVCVSADFAYQLQEVDSGVYSKRRSKKWQCWYLGWLLWCSCYQWIYGYCGAQRRCKCCPCWPHVSMLGDRLIIHHVLSSWLQNSNIYVWNYIYMCSYIIKGILPDGLFFVGYTYAGELPSCAFGFNSHGLVKIPWIYTSLVLMFLSTLLLIL